MSTISLKLPDALAARLAAAARKRGHTRSALVREILEEFLDRGGAFQGCSCLELAANLAGSVEGPEDLSVDQRHLSGYGK
jgi:predicted transcriptional regulator